MMHLDVAIVGGGVSGSSIAYHLARRGARVAVFERAAPAVEPSASWASAGGVRRQGRDPREWALALEASRRWSILGDELEADLGYGQGGHLHVVEGAEALAELERRVAREQDAGLETRLLRGSETRAVAPALAPSVIAGAYTPGDGQAGPRRTTRAFAAAAARLGAEYRLGAAVERLVVERGRVVGVVVEDERIGAEWVVLAAGAWAARLTVGISLELPVRARALQMLLTDPAPPTLVPTITATGRQLSLKQLPTGEFFIGGGWPGDIDPDGLTCRVRPESVEGSRAVATAVVPALAGRQIVQSWCGAEAQAFDGVPLIGPAPDPEGLYLAVGFSGHGFQIAPAVGRAVADDLAGAGAEALEGLRPARMLGFDRAEVARFKAEGSGALDLTSSGADGREPSVKRPGPVGQASPPAS